MTNPSTVKRVLVAPLSSLPLKTPEAIQRVKLLAGPRWSPGYPGRNELVATEESKEGYIKIAEDRFPDGRMNRKAVSDMLERLVTAANVSRRQGEGEREKEWLHRTAESSS
jgi:small subunit ribosomal protein S35